MENDKVPGYTRILLSKYIYLEFLEYLRESAVFLILLFLAMFSVGIFVKNYSFPILSIFIILFVNFLQALLNFRKKVIVLMQEEEAEKLKSK